MRGHIRQRNGKWRYIVYYQDENGSNKQYERVVEGTKKDCERALRKAINDYESGMRFNAGSVAVMFDDYLATVKQRCKYNTYMHYCGIYRNFVRDSFGNKKIGDVSVRDIIELLDNANVSGSRKQDIYTVLNGFFKFCYQIRVVTFNPLDFVQRPKRHSKKFDTLNIEEYKKLIAYCKNNLEYDYTLYIFYIALVLELECGLRRGEIAGLCWDNIDLENNTLEIVQQRVYINGHTYMDTPKTETSRRVLYFSDNVREVLSLFLTKQKKDRFYYQAAYERNIHDNIEYDFVFVWEHGEAVHPLWFYKKLKKVLSACNIKKNIRFHDLRHTNATLLLQSGVDIKTLQMRLGHSDITTTLNTYVHSDLEQQRKSIETFTKYIGG